MKKVYLILPRSWEQVKTSTAYSTDGVELDLSSGNMDLESCLFPYRWIQASWVLVGVPALERFYSDLDSGMDLEGTMMDIGHIHQLFPYCQ